MSDMFSMDNYFLGKKFSSEQEFWHYLVSLENHMFDCADGYYWGCAGGSEENYQIEAVHYFPEYKSFRKALSEWPWARTRFVIIIEGGLANRISFCSFIITAKAIKVQELWQREYEERDVNWKPKRFTPEEIAACIGELNELLVIEGKKVS